MCGRCEEKRRKKDQPGHEAGRGSECLAELDSFLQEGAIKNLLGKKVKGWDLYCILIAG